MAIVQLPDDLPSIRDATLPATYEAAQQALTECSRIDECKDWADKTAALASYAKQADDESLYRMAVKIRARAIKRCGELLREIEPKPGKRTDLEEPSRGTPTRLTRTEAADEAGLSRDQRVQALRIANIPHEEFEAAIESENPPTIEELAELGTRHQPKPLIDLGGRDPSDVSAATDVLAPLGLLVSAVSRVKAARAARGILDRERNEIRREVRAVVTWGQEFLSELEAQ